MDSGALLNTVKLPRAPNPLARGAPASWVASDAEAVWATGDGSATRVRPPAFRVIPGGLGCCNGISIGYGSVWVTDNAGISRLDAKTGAKLARIQLPFQASRIRDRCWRGLGDRFERQQRLGDRSENRSGLADGQRGH